MPSYNVSLPRATAGIAVTVGAISVVTANLRRPKILGFTIGYDIEPPASHACQVVLRRFAGGAGTSTAKTPTPDDLADPAAFTVAGAAHTVEPTYTTGQDVIGPIDYNQQNTLIWLITPGQEPIIPATNLSGIGILTPITQAIAVTASLHFQE